MENIFYEYHVSMKSLTKPKVFVIRFAFFYIKKCWLLLNSAYLSIELYNTGKKKNGLNLVTIQVLWK